ncbi:Uncharacterized protein DAT39_002887, partial [Clarias magur]
MEVVLMGMTGLTLTQFPTQVCPHFRTSPLSQEIMGGKPRAPKNEVCGESFQTQELDFLFMCRG